MTNFTYIATCAGRRGSFSKFLAGHLLASVTDVNGQELPSDAYSIQISDDGKTFRPLFGLVLPETFKVAHLDVQRGPHDCFVKAVFRPYTEAARAAHGA
jgi:hypothetical protein